MPASFHPYYRSSSWTDYIRCPRYTKLRYRGTAPTKQAGIASGFEEVVWTPPKAGMKKELVGKVAEMCLEKGGVGEKFLTELEYVDIW